MKTILSLILIVSIFLAGCNIQIPSAGQDSLAMKKFTSEEELSDYIKSSQPSGFGGYYGRGVALMAAESADSGASAKSLAPSSPDYSATNVQVAGVDEADIVKNDGKYIYLVKNEEVIIMNAYPAEDAKIISKIEMDMPSYLSEIFINEDKLIVFGQEQYNYYPGPIMPLAETRSSESAVIAESAAIAAEKMAIWPGQYYYRQPKSFIRVYDVSDKENPKLVRNLSTEGSYYDSRMIDNYVYAIFTQPVYYYPEYPGLIPLPVLYEDGVEKKLAATSIYHPIVPGYNNQYTNIIALSVVNENEEPTMESFLLDYADTMFVSEKNIYLTTPKRIDWRFHQLKIFEEAVIPSLPADIQLEISNVKASDKKDYLEYKEISEIIGSYMNELKDEQRQYLKKKIADKTEELQAQFHLESQKTVIHKIAVNRRNIEYKEQGEILGHLLNQFSMDEYKNYLRVAVTLEPYNNWRLPQESQDVSKNNVYVLDSGMDVIGKLEDLAPGERIYSARFIADRLYLVTFKRIDPLFVIDLSQPSNPSILGKLKIPGYSDYLHPYDENTIIGIGKDTEDIKEGEFERTLPKGVKLALFDVSDVANPKEIAKYNIGDRGTDSEALYEHKAFLFSREKNLLVLPITLAEFKKPAENAWQYGEYTFQGAYVFNLDKTNGFKLQGRISHIDEEEYLKAGSYPYFSNPVRRSLYIGNYLYTISDGFVKANKLDSLDEVTTIKLPKPAYYYGYDYGFGVAEAVAV